MRAGGRAGAGAPQETRYRRVRLVGVGVPASKSGDANSGILRPLARVTGNLAFTLVMHVTLEEGVSASMLEKKLKETIRQIGARLVEEEKG